MCTIHQLNIYGGSAFWRGGVCLLMALREGRVKREQNERRKWKHYFSPYFVCHSWIVIYIIYRSLSVRFYIWSSLHQEKKTTALRVPLIHGWTQLCGFVSGQGQDCVHCSVDGVPNSLWGSCKPTEHLFGRCHRYKRYFCRILNAHTE